MTQQPQEQNQSTYATPPRNPLIHYEDLRFRSGSSPLRHKAHKDGPVIAATLYLPAAAHPGKAKLPGLIVAHGAGSRRLRHRSFCEQACLAGLAVLGIDFRGHGESTGLVDGPLEEDVLAAAALLRSHPLVDGTRLGYRGSSMGGYYGLRAAAQADFSAVAVLCPANEQVMLRALERKHEWSAAQDAGLEARLNEEVLTEFFRRNSLLETVRLITCPVLIVHARGDEKVEFQHSLDLAAHLGDEAHLWLLPEGSHTSAQSSPEMHHRVITWLKTYLDASYLDA